MLILGWGLQTFSMLATSHLLTLVRSPDGSHISKLIERHQLKNPELHTYQFYETFIPAVINRGILLSLAVLVSVSACVYFGRSTLVRFWMYPSTAFNLAVFRIVVVSQLCLFNFEPALGLAGMPPEGMTIPVGWKWLAPLLPPSPEFLSNSVWVYRVLSVMALLGVATTFSMCSLVLVSLFVLLGPQLVGKLSHYHHLWLMTAILAMFPCGDALSIDSWVLRRWGRNIDPHERRTTYGRPFVYAWMTMAAMYFFPGVWKFVAGGMAWALSDNLLLKIRLKMFETGLEPAIPLYEFPVMCQFGGLTAILFEIGFPLAILFPFWRKFAAVVGVGFHEMVRLTMQISFTSLEVMYASFIDWSSFFPANRGKVALVEEIPRWKESMCSSIVVAMWIAGLSAYDGWPFAMYPHFASIEPRCVQSLEMRIFGPNPGEPHKVMLQREPALKAVYHDGVRVRSHLMKVMLTKDAEQRNSMLSGLYELWRGAHQEVTPNAIEFWQVEVPLDDSGPAKDRKKIASFLPNDQGQLLARNFVAPIE